MRCLPTGVCFRDARTTVSGLCWNLVKMRASTHVYISFVTTLHVMLISCTYLICITEWKFWWIWLISVFIEQIWDLSHCPVSDISHKAEEHIVVLVAEGSSKQLPCPWLLMAEKLRPNSSFVNLRYDSWACLIVIVSWNCPEIGDHLQISSCLATSVS